ncbi:MAG: HIT family protein [Candidatus Aenigmarchaeota archaeon]|nr:HIT family protein [Candidatus Aenigmarchaeota archaeon]
MAEDCLFCKIASGEVPAKKVYEDANSIAFLDINPRNPGHALVIPKAHAETIFQLDEEDLASLFVAVRKVSIAVKSAMKADGISISSSNGKAAGQVVNHMHVHVIPRFSSEGPVGLEGILPVKKLDDDSLSKVAETIRAGMGSPRPETAGPPPKTASEKPAKKEEKGDEEEEDLDFDF